MDSVTGQLHITIGATPQLVEGVTQGIDLSNELEMIKAAILYSDHVTLCSPTSSVFGYFNVESAACRLGGVSHRDGGGRSNGNSGVLCLGGKTAND